MWTSNVLQQDTKRSFAGFLIIILFLVLSFFSISSHSFEIDMAHRMKVPTTELPKKTSKSFIEENILDQISSSLEQAQPIVIINTEKGFVPNTLRLKKDGNYKFYVTNVNEKEKNVSFMLDAFNQHQATYYGQVKIFDVRPKVSGVFTFQCPETANQGKIVIFSDDNARDPASTTSAVDPVVLPAEMVKEAH